MLEIFGFTRDPFVHPVSLGESFSTRAGREAAKRLQYGVQLRGLVTLLGPSGSGKTTLLRGVLEQLPPSLYQTLTLSFSSGSSLDVLMNVAARLGLPISNYRGRLPTPFSGSAPIWPRGGSTPSSRSTTPSTCQTRLCRTCACS